MADIFLMPTVHWAVQGPLKMSLDKYPNIKAVYENCLKLDEFKAACPENQVCRQVVRGSQSSTLCQ